MSYFVPTVVLSALLACIGMFGGPDLRLAYAIVAAVIACPCALGLATPIGRTALMGILIKDA